MRRFEYSVSAVFYHAFFHPSSEAVREKYVCVYQSFFDYNLSIGDVSSSSPARVAKSHG